MSTKSEVLTGVIGLGFMGATHIRAYQAAAASGYPCRLIAVADPDTTRLSGTISTAGNLDTGTSSRLFDPATTTTYADPAALLSDPRIHLVSICTHTDSHVELAIAALSAGKHVLVEKPVAISSLDVHRLAEVARGSGKLCMPGMCMRFWPAWDWLHEKIQTREFGRVLSATFHRLGCPPAWSHDFYNDFTRSGGTLFDLHIHDTDFIRWCFGRPSEVVSTGSMRHLTTLYRYPQAKGPMHVVAEGGQDHSPGFGFRMRYVVAFEHATADFDIGRSPKLLLSRDGKCEPVPIEEGAGYDGQIRHLVRIISEGKTPAELRATLEQAVEVTQILEAERQSFETGRAVALS